MARIKGAVNAHKKRRKMLKLAKGYYGAKSKQYRAASEQVRRSLRYAYEGRKMRKRDFRRLWITRINAAARMNGISYSVLMNGLKQRNITINKVSIISGVTQSTVSDIVNGKTNNAGVATIQKLCDGLEISIREFFDSDLFDDLDQEVK